MMPDAGIFQMRGHRDMEEESARLGRLEDPGDGILLSLGLEMYLRLRHSRRILKHREEAGRPFKIFLVVIISFSSRNLSHGHISTYTCLSYILSARNYNFLANRIGHNSAFSMPPVKAAFPPAQC